MVCLGHPYHRLSEVFQYKTQSRCRIGHRVRSVQNNESVECRIIKLDFGRDANPIYPVTSLSDAWETYIGEGPACDLNIAAVQQWIPLCAI